MRVSRKLLAHTPKYGWKLETLRGLSLGARGQGLAGAKRGCGGGCEVWAAGACWQRARREVLGWKPFHGSSENHATGPFHLMGACGRGMATRGHATARMLEHLSLAGREISGCARVPAVSTHSAQISSGELSGEHSKASQHQSYFLKGKYFFVQFYAAIWCGGHLSQRTVSGLLMAGDVKLQPGQDSSAKVILSSSQSKKCQGDNKMLLLKALPGINNLF